MNNNSVIRVESGKIFISNKLIELPYPVIKTKEWKDYIIVMVEAPTGKILNRNIYAFTLQGTFKWQIEESPHGIQEDKPFVDFYVSQEDELIVCNWIGIDYSVDIITGKIVVKTFNR